jgi:hypothetical protein
MEINRQNYEMYLLDYIEGNLPEHMVLAMLTFLKNNPEIEIESNALMENAFVAETIKFDHKELLKKNPAHDIIGISKFEQLSIAYLENDISPLELESLKKELDHDKNKFTEHQLLNKTKLQPDFSIVFPNKKQLKKQPATFWLPEKFVYVAIAASVALVVGFAIFFRPNSNQEFGKTIAFKNHDFKNRNYYVNQTATIQVVDKQVSTANNIENTDTTNLHERFDVETLISKQMALLEMPLTTDQILISSNSIANQFNINSKTDDYNTLQSYIEKRFKEKVLKQKENDKVTFISLVNAFGRFTQKVFNKKIEVEKSKTENGSSLYAIKTDSYNFYTIRSARKKSENKDSN